MFIMVLLSQTIILVVLLCINNDVADCYSYNSIKHNTRTQSLKPLYDSNTNSNIDNIIASKEKESMYITEFDEKSKKTITIDLKRFLSYNILALFLAIGSNFLGVTSMLLSNTNTEYFRSIKVDQLYPIGGFSRHVDTDDKYEFIFPDNYIQDQRVLIAESKLLEMPLELRKRQSTPGIDTAFLSKKNRLENISVIKSNVLPGFTMRSTLGTPVNAAKFLLENNIAPVQSGKTYELLNSYEKVVDGVLYYVFEYTINKPGTTFDQHTISVIAERSLNIYTATATIPSKLYDIDKNDIKLHTIIDSFKLI